MIKDTKGHKLEIGVRVGVYNERLTEAVRGQTLVAYHDGEDKPYEIQNGERFKNAIKDHTPDMDVFISNHVR